MQTELQFAACLRKWQLAKGSRRHPWKGSHRRLLMCVTLVANCDLDPRELGYRVRRSLAKMSCDVTRGMWLNRMEKGSCTWDMSSII